MRVRLAPLTVALEPLMVALEADFDETKHPRDDHGRFGEGDGEKGSTTVDSAANRWAKYRTEGGDPMAAGTKEGFERSGIIWCATFEGCDGVQAAADTYVGVGTDFPGKDDPNGTEYAFAARELIAAANEPDHPGHYEEATTLYRGMPDPDGKIAAAFAEGTAVNFAIASFSPQQDTAEAFAEKEPGAQVMLVTAGTVAGADVGKAVGSSEVAAARQ